MFKRTGNLISIQIEEPSLVAAATDASKIALRGTKFARFDSGSDTDDDDVEESGSEKEQDKSAEIQVTFI